MNRTTMQILEEAFKEINIPSLPPKELQEVRDFLENKLVHVKFVQGGKHKHRKF